MEYMNKWNSIVEVVRKNYTAKEELVQQSWEFLFQFVFGYAVSEIDAQRTIKMGSTERGKPDIILCKDGEEIFVVELKRHIKHDGREQLFSYLNQLKMNLGVVVCDKLYLYDYDFTQKENAYAEVEIPFEENNEDGAKFVELFSKDNFDKQKICDFIRSKSNSKDVIAKIKSETTSELINDLLKAHFKAKYAVSDEDFDSAISSLSISLQPRISTQTISAFEKTEKRTESYNLYAPEVIYKVSGNIVSAKVFNTRLLETKSAQRTWIYSNGTVDTDIWNASNFSETSSLSSNIHSTSKYRCWKETGLIKIILEIE